MKWKWRLFWLVGLLLLWLLCSGVAQAGPLADRLAQYPDWQGKPPTQMAQGDLAYPDWFLGNWQVTTTLIDMAAPLAPEVVTPGFEGNRQFLNQPVRFNVRFVPAQPTGLTALLPPLRNYRQAQIISDRAYNGLSLAKAYLGDRTVAVKVDPSNPNRQITLLKGNRQLVSTVTDRATEASSSDQFITTELFRQEFRGAPQLYFNDVENTTAYTRQVGDRPDQTLITADQVTAIYLSPQDPDYFKTTGDSLAAPRPVALYRYRMELVPAHN